MSYCVLLLLPLLLFFFFNKCNTLALLMIIQVQTIGVRGLLLPCSLEVKVFVFLGGGGLYCFPVAAALLLLKMKIFCFYPSENPASSPKYVKPLKQDNISFFLMFGFTFRLSKQSHRTAVLGGVYVLNDAPSFIILQSNKDNNLPLRCPCVLLMAHFSGIIPNICHRDVS